MSSAPITINVENSGKMPAIFVAHGAPVLLDDVTWMSELAVWAQRLPRPRAILMVSAHWEQRPVAIGATEPVPLIYDFYGFPEKYYRTEYPAPGAKELAARVAALLPAQGIAVAQEPLRGLDHGAYVPLLAMYQAADVPVLQISIPRLVSEELVALGRALSPLRREGVLIMGSGFLTHNMRFAFKPGIPAWAREFDAWVADALLRWDVEALVNFRDAASSSNMALPTWEHFAPLLVTVGAAIEEERPKVTFPIEGWWMDSAFTKRSVQLG